jgi:hypothetical protein
MIKDIRDVRIYFFMNEEGIYGINTKY